MIFDNLFSKKIIVKYRHDDTQRIHKISVGDWIDLSVDIDVSMGQGEYLILPLGVAMQLPKGYEAHIIPRSSTFGKYGVLQANSSGLIDESYRGDNDWWGFPAYATRNTTIKRGTRICQFRIVKKQSKLKIKEVKFFNSNSRGGFGSTGN